MVKSTYVFPVAQHIKDKSTYLAHLKTWKFIDTLTKTDNWSKRWLNALHALEKCYSVDTKIIISKEERSTKPELIPFTGVAYYLSQTLPQIRKALDLKSLE